MAFGSFQGMELNGPIAWYVENNIYDICYCGVQNVMINDCKTWVLKLVTGNW